MYHIYINHNSNLSQPAQLLPDHQLSSLNSPTYKEKKIIRLNIVRYREICSVVINQPS